MKRAIIFAIALFAISSSAFASVTQLLQDADSLYARKQYARALIYYQQAEKESAPSAALLFNLGNAATLDNHYGEAMVAYQRAAELDPGNPRIRQNISFLQSKIDARNVARLGGRKGDMAHYEPSGLQALWIGVTVHNSPDMWGWLAFDSFLLLLTGVLCYVLSPNVLVRKIGFFGAILFLCSSIVFGIFTSAARSHWEKRRECVVTAFEAQMLPHADKDAKAEIPPVVAGTLLTMPETDTKAPEGWVFVRLNPSTSGWLPTADVTIL